MESERWRERWEMELSWVSEVVAVGVGYEDVECAVMLEAGVEVEPLVEAFA